MFPTNLKLKKSKAKIKRVCVGVLTRNQLVHDSYSKVTVYVITEELA